MFLKVGGAGMLIVYVVSIKLKTAYFVTILSGSGGMKNCRREFVVKLATGNSWRTLTVATNDIA